MWHTSGMAPFIIILLTYRIFSLQQIARDREISASVLQLRSSGPHTVSTMYWKLRETIDYLMTLSWPVRGIYNDGANPEGGTTGRV